MDITVWCAVEGDRHFMSVATRIARQTGKVFSVNVQDGGRGVFTIQKMSHVIPKVDVLQKMA